MGRTNIAPTFLNIVIVQPYASAALSPKEGMTDTHLTGDWFGHKTRVDILEERKFLAASVNGTLDCPAHETDKIPGLLFTEKVV